MSKQVNKLPIRIYKKTRTVPIFIPIFIFIIVTAVFCSKAFATSGMMVYFSSGSLKQTPVYRNWDGAAWSSTSTVGDVGARASNWYVLKECPKRDEKILGVRDAEGHINVMIWNGSSWSSPIEISTYKSYDQCRTFDMAYENISGDAVVVYKTTDSKIPEYMIWNGSAWAGPYDVSMSTHGKGTVVWIGLASKPGGDEIVLGIQDYGKDISFHVWNGSSWGNSIVTEWDTEVATAKCFDIAYEQLSRDAMIVWAGGSSDNFYRIWNGVWSSSDTINMGAIDVSVTNGAWIKLAADPGSDNIIMGTIEKGTYDLDAVIWDGSSWNDPQEVEIELPTVNRRYYDVAFEQSSGDAMIVFSDNTDTPKYYTYSGGSWSGGSANATADAAVISWVVLAPDPGSDEIMLLTSDTSNDINVQKWNGVDTWGAIEEKETNSDDTYECLAMYIPDIISPAAISNLTALAGTGDGEITLKWTAPGDNGVSGNISGGTYRIKASTYPITSGNFDSITHNLYYTYSIDKSTAFTDTGSEHSYTVAGLYAGTTYYFAIKLDDGSNNWSVWPGTSAAINSKSFTQAPDFIPSVFVDLTATGENQQVLLNWTEPDMTDLDYYKFYRDSTTPYDFIDSYTFSVNAGNSSYIDTGLTNGVTYYYRAETWDMGSGSGGLYSIVYSSGYSNIALAYADNPDKEPPVIAHTPLTSRALGRSSIYVEFEVTDNLGVEEVSVTYRGIGNVDEYTVSDSPDTATTSFNATLELNKSYISGEGLEYKIEATDGVNTTVGPETGWYSVEIPDEKPEQKFVTPSNPEVVFGSDVEEVTITDVRGNKVFSEKKGNSPFIVWNPKKNGKVKIESGMYIYRIKTSDGDKYGPIIIAK